MKNRIPLLFLIVASLGCNEKPASTTSNSITGTWKLASSKIISKGDTTITFPVANQEMIKMFTEREFAFFKHNTNHTSKDSAVFDAGSGTYTLNGENYSEHLTYCNYREWENRDFHFNLRMHNDTLIQTGIEKIDSLNIDQEILEIYVKKR
jgi:hypothetical protein